VIAVGVVRPDLIRTQDAQERFEVMIGNAAKSDGASLAQIVEYDPARPDRLLTAIQDAAADIVYAPYRAHVSDIVTQILQYARLDLILDGHAWPRAAIASEEHQ
jgi:hypothetical protein